MGAGSGKQKRANAAAAATSTVSLPSLRITDVYHIGTLREKDKGMYGSSYEGHGLSVSVDPEEWRRIAKLGGLPWHRLTNPRARFVAAHELDEEQRQGVVAWAVARGYAVERVAYETSYYDDELEDEMRMLHESAAEAREEAAPMGADEGDDGAVREVVVVSGTPELERRIGMDSGIDAFDHLLAVYVDEELPQFDGVWWEDEYAPMSAPRGVIMPPRISRWHSEAVSA